MKHRQKKRRLSALLALALVFALATPAYAKTIDDYKKDWADAKARGDQAGMDAAHAGAEAERAKQGYSGGADGSQHITITPSTGGGGGGGGGSSGGGGGGSSGGGGGGSSGGSTVSGTSSSGSSYPITSELGQGFVNSAPAGSTMSGGDGSTWTKNADGSTTITKNGTTYTVPAGSSSPAPSSGGGGGGGGSYYANGTGTGVVDVYAAAEEIAQNSAAWYVAKAEYNAAVANGDTAAAAAAQSTMTKLHDANTTLASQVAGSGGAVTFNDTTGVTTIRTVNGTTITNANGVTQNGSTTTMKYQITDSNGSQFDPVSTTQYSDATVQAYLAAGGTVDGLISSYNQTAEEVAKSGQYGDMDSVLGTGEELTLVKYKYNLSDAQVQALGDELEAAKKSYLTAHDAYIAAKTSGDAAAMEAAIEDMVAANAAAEAARGKIGYSGNSSIAADGGFFDVEEALKAAAGYDYTPSQHGTDVRTFSNAYAITAAAGAGGSISPDGTVYVAEGKSQTFTITPDDGCVVSVVTVDGADIGRPTSYTFSNVTATHTISVTFAKKASLAVSGMRLTDSRGLDLSRGTIKSGYGVFVTLDLVGVNVEDVAAVLTYNFGEGQKRVTLQPASVGASAREAADDGTVYASASLVHREASASSVEQQMAANSAAWWDAYQRQQAALASGDTAAANAAQREMNALHAANEALAAAQSSGGTMVFDSGTGTWTSVSTGQSGTGYATGGSVVSTTDGNASAQKTADEQMKENSAAWWDAYQRQQEAIASGDTEAAETAQATMDALQEANEALAAQQASSGGGTAVFNSGTGTWTIVSAGVSDTEKQIIENSAARSAAYAELAAAIQSGDTEAKRAANEKMAALDAEKDALYALRSAENGGSGAKTIAEQRSANSAAWWDAYQKQQAALASGNSAAADAAQRAMDALHDANTALAAAQASAGGGSASFDSGTGTWTLSGSSGSSAPTQKTAGEQMKANSAAWLVAYQKKQEALARGDTVAAGTAQATMDALHAVNVAIASAQAAGNGSAAAFDSGTGTWTFSGGASSGGTSNAADGLSGVTSRSGGSYVLPVNAASPIGARCVYIPVAAPDGKYTVSISVTGKDAVTGDLISTTKSATITVSGSMYEDDFTGNSRR